MVLLTMTPGIVRAVARAAETSPDAYAELQRPSEPSLAAPKTGNPISHSQLIDLSKLLKQHASSLPSNTGQMRDDELAIPATLNDLLRASTLYTPPPPPKKSPTPEYTALMARLRADQEALSYSRMLHPPPTRETFSQRFPRAPEPFSLGASAPLSDDDELSYEEVHRQVILIINVLVSIVAVAVFIWVAARHWTVGKRLGLSMGGAAAVAVAEVTVYGGYVRKIKEAKRLEKRKPEIKEIVRTWVIEKEGEGKMVGIKEQEKGDEGVRFRKGKHR